MRSKETKEAPTVFHKMHRTKAQSGSRLVAVVSFLAVLLVQSVSAFGKALSQHTYSRPTEFAAFMTSEASIEGAQNSPPADPSSNMITMVGFGSLLSETSSRLTFPTLTNFRLARVPGYRRVFGHPASIFFQRKIANLETLEISSLSVEYVDKEFPGFVAAVFEVPNDNYIQDNGGKEDSSAVVPSEEYLKREEEFDFALVPFEELGGSGRTGSGIICTRSTDQTYLDRWGKEHFENQFGVYGVDTIWHWPNDSGMKPCAVYMRHCYLAAQKMGPACFDSFLDETFLIDRQTTFRQYVAQHPETLEKEPPPELAIRYSG